jgi:hypothetical protein
LAEAVISSAVSASIGCAACSGLATRSSARTGTRNESVMQDSNTIGTKRNGNQRSDDMNDLFKDDVSRLLFEKSGSDI